MRVPIIDNIVMTSDQNNIMLNREEIRSKGKDKGKKYLVTYAWYPTVVEALEGVLNEKMRESTARTLNGLVRSHHELLMELRGLFETLKTSD